MKTTYRLRAYYFLILLLAGILNFIGVLIVRSAANMDSAVFIRQIIGSVAGFCVCIGVSLINYDLYVRFHRLIYGAVIAFLVAVIVWGGVHHGAGRWITVPILGQLQPAEFSKTGLILYFASYFERNREKLNEVKVLFTAIFLFLVPAVLIFIEPNLSTAIIIFVIFAFSYFSAGLSRFWTGVFGGGLAGLTGLLLFAFRTDRYQYIPFLKGYHKDRILSFLYPDVYSDTYFQQENSIMAIGSGGFFGKGLFNTDISSVKAGNFLIEEDTDFIFAIMGEELGFRGCLLILLAFLLLIILILWIAGKSKDVAGSVICTGTAAWIGFQTFTNIAVATAIFPNTGVTLPFFSRGVSSLLALYLALGVVLNVGLQCKD